MPFTYSFLVFVAIWGYLLFGTVPDVGYNFGRDRDHERWIDHLAQGAKMKRIACIGEAMIELSMDGDQAHLAVAGDTLNTAIYLKRSWPDDSRRLCHLPWAGYVFKPHCGVYRCQ